MIESYGIVPPVISGQESSDVERADKDCYVYDIKHDIIGSIEIANTVFKGPYQYRITVDRIGDYLFRGNVLGEASTYNADTGKTRKLTGYFVLKDKNGKKIKTYYFSEFKETMARLVIE